MSSGEALARALRTMHARIRVDEATEPVPFACDAAFFVSVALVNLGTEYTELDVAFEPSGVDDWDAAFARSELMVIDGVETAVCSLEDIIRSKSAANRPKDRAALPALLALRDRLMRDLGKR